jgi:hypothetical protein
MPAHDDSPQPAVPGSWATSSSDVRVVVHMGAGTVLQQQAWRRLWALLLADGSPSHGEAAVKENPAPVGEISGADGAGDSQSST